jgi:type IV secretion system protein VirD4
MPPEVLRTLPEGLGTLLLRRGKPAVVDLMHWRDRNDGEHLRDSQRQFETAGQDAARHGRSRPA